MLHVLTWLWSQPGGRTKYTAEHVHIWANMVSRNLAMQHRLSCVTTETDLPSNVERIDPPGEFEDVQPKWGAHKPNCFRRLAMFKRDAAKAFGKRFVCMDLDVVIGGQLDPLFNRHEPLVLFKGTAPGRHYNGSLQLIKAGSHPELYEDFDQAGADASGEAFHGSDQAWLCYRLGAGIPTWDQSDGVHWWNPGYPGSWDHKRGPDPTVLFFPGKFKPWTYHKIFPWMRKHYRIAEKEAA